MRYDVLMFVAMLTALAASGVHALIPPQPVSETRVALIERDYEYLRGEMEEIKQILKKQNDEKERWIIIVLGLLITGDRGWTILRRFKNNKREGKS